MTLMDAILLSLQKPSFWYACFIITYVFYLWSRRKQYVLSWQLAGPLAFPLIGNSYLVLDGGVSNVINKMHKAMRDYW
ncbi:probable cytochrome P450 313a2 [Diaphorina citri]|uniref:Probable cytochrome P450 313a2 n=1 Tax=Diaphorina citri TaxID=121845 RepID=A0A3Q0ITD7_DIACI|nr:probable cytochrome P450 313a2 [Diaphorina citri]